MSNLTWVWHILKLFQTDYENFKIFINTLRESPNDAEIISHKAHDKGWID